MQYLNYNQNISQEHFSSGHLGLVFCAVILLVGISWMKDPQLFSNLKIFNSSGSASTQRLALAYPDTSILYQNDDTQSLVAGASTTASAQSQTNGPSILNEDGSVSSALSGEVLGVSTQDVSLSLNAIAVNTIPDSEAAVKDYFANSQNAEMNNLDNVEFETALTSNNQMLIDAQVAKMTNIIAEMQVMSVPVSLAKLQKLRILQYNSAVVVLNNFSRADDNPELVSQALGVFFQAQDQIEQEVNVIQQKFNLESLSGGVNVPPLGQNITD
jgi:hypothetical protein